MWVLRLGAQRFKQTPEQVQRELEHDELKGILEDIASSLRGIDASLAALAEDSYKRRMER